ncbi:SMP-30/gluconolactonase/LRE family protein [Oscillospiraceae bacterium PP1C4]
MDIAQIAYSNQAKLGEGIFWDTDLRCLRYVDIDQHQVHTFNPKTGANAVLDFSQTVGCIALDQQGDLIAALKNTIVHIACATGQVDTVYTLDLPSFMRFNDGKCDCKGRLWVGTMAKDQSDPRAPHAGTLYRIDEKNGIVPMVTGLTISNGIAWNLDNTKMYHIDTAQQKIFCYDFDAESGEISNRSIAVTVSQADGSPDGMTIDIEGMLWVALWGGSKVVRYNPHTGKKLDEVGVPAKLVTCCAFGGENMDELFITTAMDSHGAGGEVYSCKTNTKGIPSNRYFNKKWRNQYGKTGCGDYRCNERDRQTDCPDDGKRGI